MDIPIALFFVLFVCVVLYLGYGMLKHGGVKGAMFGATVERTVGEVPTQKRGPISAVVKVHLLRRSLGERLVGLELVGKSIMSYETVGYVLSPLEAQRLALLLQEAAGAKKAI